MEENNKHIALIFKYLSGDLEKPEEILFYDMLKDREDFKHLFEEYQKVWNLSRSKLIPEIEAINLNAEWELFMSRNGLNGKILNIKKRPAYFAFKIAAAVLLFVFMGVGAFYTFLPKNETIVAENLPLETKLPDGTEITINKNSEISYNNRYNKKNRTIQLKGDAFFNVQKNNDISFIIEAQDFFVEVMGTQFYVNSNPKQRKVIVTEGIVAVYREKDKKDMIVLSAGEEMIFDKTENTLTKTETQNLNVLSWKTKQFTFKDKTLEEVAAELEAVYAVTFEFLNENLKSCRLSVSFDNQEIEEILNVLTATFEKVSFKREGQKIYIDGSACY